jgi:hypothetical protein
MNPLVSILAGTITGVGGGTISRCVAESNPDGAGAGDLRQRGDGGFGMYDSGDANPVVGDLGGGVWRIGVFFLTGNQCVEALEFAPRAVNQKIENGKSKIEKYLFASWQSRLN